MKRLHPKHLKHTFQNRSRRFQLLTFVAIFAVLGGGYLLFTSFAAPIPAAKVSNQQDAKSRALTATGTLTAGTQAIKIHPDKHDKVQPELVATAKDRVKDLKELLNTDPHSARDVILDDQSIADLTSQAVPVEQKVTLKGKYRLLQIEDEKGKDVAYDQLVTPDNKVYTLKTEQPLPRVTGNSTITVSGYLVSDGTETVNQTKATPSSVLLVNYAAGTNTTNTSTITATAAPLTVNQLAPVEDLGTLPTAVVAIHYTDKAGINFNSIKNLFEGNINGVSGNNIENYFKEVSYGKTLIAPTYFGTYNTGKTCANSSDIVTDGLQAILAVNPSTIFSQYKRYVIASDCHPGGIGTFGTEQTSQGYITAGFAQLGESGSVDNQNELGGFTHELAHTMGGALSHGAFYDCRPDVFVAPTYFGSDNDCLSLDYKDLFEVLGDKNAMGHLNAFHKSKSGWLDTTTMPSLTTPGTYTFNIAPFEKTPGTGQVSALNIPLDSSGKAFTVEYRQPIGFDSWMNGNSGGCAQFCNINKGALIHFVYTTTGGPGGTNDVQLLDANPGSQAGQLFDEQDSALEPGKTFTDPSSGTQISTLSADSNGLQVSVTIPQAASCVRNAPAVSALSTSSQTVAPGGSASYSLTVTNTDAASCKPNQFKYAPDSMQSPTDRYSLVTSIATPDNFTLAPGASTTVTVNQTVSLTATDGAYIPATGSDRVYSNSGKIANVAAFSLGVSSPADTQPPSAPTSFTGSTLGSRVVKLNWQLASDNTGVSGYKINRDGSQLFFVKATDTVFIDKNVFYSTSYTYTIQAYDHKMNLSSPVTVNVTTPPPAASDYPVLPHIFGSATDHSINPRWFIGPTTGLNGTSYEAISPCITGPCFLPSTTSGVLFSGLTSLTDFYVSVTANTGENLASNGRLHIFTAAAGTSAPSTPQGLYVDSSNSSGIVLKWTPSTDDKGVAYYKVYRSVDESNVTAFRRIGTSTTTSFTDASIQRGGTYHVQAVDTDGSVSSPSSYDGVQHTSSTSTPVKATVSGPANGATVSGTITLTASTAGTGTEKVTYYIDGFGLGDSISSPYSLTLDTTRQANGPHTLVAEAYGTNGTTGSTGPINFTINNGGGGDITPPAVKVTSPTSGSNVSGNAVALAANATDNTGGSGVSRVDFSVDGSVVSSDNTSPYTGVWDSTKKPNGAHFISATAYDNAGNPNTDQVSVTSTNADSEAPSTPGNLTGTGTSTTSINISWDASTDNVGVAKYSISRNGAPLTEVNGSITSFDDTGLLPGVSYSYTVTALDAAGNPSIPTSPVSVTTLPPPPDTVPPSAPSNLTGGVLSATQVNLFWTASTDNVGIARYDIYRSDNTRTPKASVSGTTTSFGDTTTLGGHSYSYYIYAYDSAGNKSLTSNKITVTTPAVSTTLGSMTGRVVDGNGKALTSGSVYYYLGTSKKSYNLNSNGNYTISGIVPNTYTFTYICTGCNTETVTGIQILAGQNLNRPDQVLHKLGGISGLVTDAATNKALSNVIIGYTLNGVAKTLKTSNHTPTNYALTSLPPGDYTVTYTLSGYVTQTKTLTIGLDQTLTQDISMSK